MRELHSSLPVQPLRQGKLGPRALPFSLRPSAGTYTLTETAGNDNVTEQYLIRYYDQQARTIVLGYERKKTEDGGYTLAKLTNAEESANNED